jgi:hypothetical protein
MENDDETDFPIAFGFADLLAENVVGPVIERG